VTFLAAQTCEDVQDMLPGVAQFEGRYQAQPQRRAVAEDQQTGTFTVLVFDQGNKGRARGEFTGDYFSIELYGGRYSGYTRGGYIEGGNVQVK
jgi:hypothetical protein